MKIALIVGLAIIGLIIGGVLYVRHKIAEKFGGAALKESFGDLGRSVALPMMDDQWLGERRPAPMPTEGAPRIARATDEPK
ncbi:hypothetical protein HRbin10_02045 [bacterium HR10]|nr:hypothetical protein HRbin10_02045 [bacterium HR10]